MCKQASEDKRRIASSPPKPTLNVIPKLAFLPTGVGNELKAGSLIVLMEEVLVSGVFGEEEQGMVGYRSQ